MYARLKQQQGWPYRLYMYKKNEDRSTDNLLVLLQRFGLQAVILYARTL